MPTPRPADDPRLKLASLLRGRKEELIQKWRDRVLRDPSVTEANRLSEPDLRDHMPNLLDAVISDLEGTEAGEATGRAIGAGTTAREHARQRVANGYSLTEALRELSHFRSAVLDLCIQQGVLLEDGATKLLHAAIDESMVTGADEMDRAAIASLRQQAAFRERFIGILGHDLRTPLQAIRLGAAALLKLADASPQQVSVLRRIAAGSERMGRMIADLLDVTRARLGGGLPMDPRPCDLSDLVQQAQGELEIAYPDRTVERRVTGDLQGVWDADRLAQMLSNLLVNALDYGAPGTPVQVHARAAGAQVIVAVNNQGALIAPERLTNLFDPFVQGAQDDRARRESNGLGLGLFIAKQIVETHGGFIEVTSTQEDGTTFTVHLPRAVPIAGAATLHP